MGRSISPAPGSIKSVQRGTISISGAVTSNTATITAVDTSKSQLRFLGCSADGTSFSLSANVVLTNATTITATRFSTAGTTIAAWELIEVY